MADSPQSVSNTLKKKETEGITSVELSEYVLEPLHRDEEFILSQGWHQNRTDAPSVLVLAPVSTRPTPEILKRMEHDYSLRLEVDPDWAARPIALVRHEGQIVLVLEHRGGQPLDRLIHGPMEMSMFLQIAIGLTSALSRLHKRELIHKDVKPANVLVDYATSRVWLMGFGIASRLPRERQSPEPPEFIAGTLPYMAPEQTGRMNRSVDSRSDLYSLGVTLYEMLTGSLPFTASDPMEWVHCHVARQPASPSEKVKAVPASLSNIILKFLAKTPEERYQTAAGAESDLRRCIAEWGAHGRIDEFPLGQHDTPDRLMIPEKLYGRDSEIETLLASFDRVVARGRPELVLVSGYSGIGKSAVVNELHKPLVPPRGLFASGKFDQYKRDIPYATLAQAFQSLLRPLLSKSESELSKWRDALIQALDPNGLLIIDLVPELKLIIGEQPPVPELPPQDAQARFQLVFRRFISVFAREEHPLALFLDDLQWLDTATLDLIEDLLTRPEVKYLMLIGAYRDNEVDPTHPLVRKIEDIRQAGAIVKDVVLSPLTSGDVGRLIRDCLHSDAERAAPLAEMVHTKTGGNPFFAIQFISALAEESLLTFDHGKARWSWDLNLIHSKGYTDNVVDLMVGKLGRLPVETVKALQQLACLGNSAEFATLKMIYRVSDEELHDQLWHAVRAGVIFRSAESYKFLHDRVQEAAYTLIPERSRAEAHLRTGRLLAEHTAPEKLEEGIFEIVNQLNRGSQLITSREERERVAESNFIAGRRAKNSTAYASALKYLAAGRALLTETTWDSKYELIFSIEYLMAECELLTADMGAAENRLSKLARRVKSGHDDAVVTRLRLTLYTTLDQSDRGVEVCLDYLRRTGTDWALRPSREEVLQEYNRIWSLIGNRQIEDLVELPAMTDTGVLDALDVLTEVVTPALFYDENLCSLVICRMINLSLEHGNSDGSCFAYVWFAIIAGPRFGNYKDGFRFGRLGYELVEMCGLKRYQARTYMSFGNIVMPWAKHALEGRELVRRAFDAAYRIGDLTFAAYSCNELITNFLIVGDPLDEVQREAETGLAFALKARFGLVVDVITAQLGLIRTLRGLTPKFGCFNDEGFDEVQFEGHLASNPLLALPEFWYWARKTQARFLAGDYASAIDASLNAHRLFWTSPSQLETAEFRFYAALSQAAYWYDAPPDKKKQHFEALLDHHKQLEIWAEHCPENFENRAALAEAEIARIEGRELDAERLYERAIHSAHANGFVHNEALAGELAARFYAARGFQKISHAYLRDARYCYNRWGATGKVSQLDEMYPFLGEERPAGPSSTIVAGVGHLDLTTVIKVSQAVLGQLDLSKLIETLLCTAVEHAGAQRGVLVLSRADERWIAAEATTSHDTVVVRMAGESVAGASLPESIVRYVARTRESVILDDASAQNPFADDGYLKESAARSVLCLPLINPSNLIGVLYLENNLASHVFTPPRVTVLKLLASLAAISLENTGLYRDIAEREAILRESEARLHAFFGNSPNVIFLKDRQGRYLYVNNEFNRAYRIAGKQVEGKTDEELFPGEQAASFHATDQKVLDAAIAMEFEEVSQREDGLHTNIVQKFPLFDDAGGIYAVGSIATDITERKREESARRYSDERYRVVVETASDVVISSDDNGIILLANPATERIFGYEPSELIGKPLTILMPAFMRERHDNGFRRYLATGKRHINWLGTELIGQRKNGDTFPVEVSFGELTTNGHRVFTGFIRDISEKKRAEEALRRSEAYLAEAQRLAHAGAWAFSPSTPERGYWSSEFYRIYGFDPAKDRPHRSAVLDRVHPDDRGKVDRTFEEAMHKKADFENDFRIVLPDGTRKHLHMVAHPVVGQDGELVEFVGTSMDVTEQYQNRAALEKAFQEIRTLKDQLYKENLALRDEVDETSMFEEIIGTSPPMRAVLASMAKVAPTNSTVFITGETGTGKELIARAVHKQSRRAGRAFVSVNCAALAPSLISSELFGHEKGAFTGATQRRLGRFELADGGTIFLDEAGELPPDTQVALLRVLQEREFERVGGNRSIRVDVRVIAATNRDLKVAIAAGTFRPDLFYRLNVFPIEVPPLRERSEDILMLLEYFVRRYASRTGKNIRSIEKKTLQLFQSYDWPGNIRELQNVIERSVIVSSGDVFSVDESWLSRESSTSLPASQACQTTEGRRPDEREKIEAALTECKGRVAGPQGAAAKLGIPPSTLESRIRALKINKSEFKFA